MRNDLKIVTVIQARMNSTRLPGKVLLPIMGKPLLLRMIDRVKLTEQTGTIVVATTTEPQDDVIYELCTGEDINIYRGHSTDLLDRHYQIGLKFDADIIIKIPSDCPLIDPAVITKVLTHFINHFKDYDYASNLHPATFPDGNDVEAISMSALYTAWREANRSFEREHTTPYLWENPEKFKILNLTWDTGLDYSMSHRWTLDYLEDYIFIKNVFEELYPRNPEFTLYDILDLLKSKPHLKKINEKYAGVNWYRHHLEELKTVTSKQTKDLNEIES